MYITYTYIRLFPLPFSCPSDILRLKVALPESQAEMLLEKKATSKTRPKQMQLPQFLLRLPTLVPGQYGDTSCPAAAIDLDLDTRPQEVEEV